MPEPGNQESAAERDALSRRQVLAAGGGIAGAAAVGSALTAGTAEAVDRGDSQIVRSVSLAQAKIVLRAAEREARRMRIPSFIVVIDACGDPKATLRQDDNSRASLELAPLKAQTALAFRTSTATLAERVANNAIRAQSFLAAGFTLLGGGAPIMVGRQAIGAIGVGGGSPEQDAQIAEAGLAALR